MADIKAKDISIAQSIASSDLILGSSIAGTTANVTVETVGNYLINNLPIANLGNASVSSNILRIKDSIRDIQNLHSTMYQRRSLANNEWKYMDISITVPQNHIYLIEAVTTYQNTRPYGIALSHSNTRFDPYIFNDNTSNWSRINSGVCLSFGSETFYIWAKRDFVSPDATDNYYIRYVDLGEINSI